MTYKEIGFCEEQEGFGLAVTNPVTNTRALVGIFESRNEAEKELEKRRKNVKYPRIVEWSKEIYEKYDYVFEK